MATTQRRQQMIIMTVLLLGSFITTLAETLMNTALPTIMRELHISQMTAQWLSTGYMLAAGIMMPTAAYFTNRVKLRPLFITIMTTFLTGLIISASASSFTFLLIGRLIQALAVGISMPLVQNVITLISPINKRGLMLGVTGVVINLGPAVGPTLSGYIVDHYSWRMLFLCLIPLAALALILGIFLIKNITPTRPDRLDVPSLLLSTVGFGALLYGFSNIGVTGRLDRASLIWIIVGTVIIAAFIYRQLHLAQPLLELRVFLAPSFRKVAVLALLSAIALMGPELIIPLFNQNILGLTALVSGLALLPGALLMAILSLVSGRIYDQIGIKKLAYLGFGLAILATVPFIYFGNTTTPIMICLTYALRISGLTLVYMPIIVYGLNALPAAYVVHGSTLIVTIRQLASSLGTALMVATITLGRNAGLQQGLSSQLANAQGYRWTFILTLIITGLCLLWSLRLKNKTSVEL